MGLEAGKANLQRHHTPRKPLSPGTTPYVGRKLQQDLRQHRPVPDVLGKGRLAGDRLARTAIPNDGRSDAPRLLVEQLRPLGAEVSRQKLRRPRPQLGDRAQAQPLQGTGGALPDAPQLADRHGPEKIQHPLGPHHRHTTWLAIVRGELGDKPVRPETDGRREPNGLEDAPLGRGRNLLRGAH